MGCCTSLRRTANGKRCILVSTVAVICIFIALAGEWSLEVTCPHSAAAPFSSLDCNRLTRWPRLVKQHAKSCLPPVAVCEECSKLRPLFFFFSPLQAKHVLPHYVLVWARPRLLTQTQCNLFNPPLSWADKAWPPNARLHLTQPRE